MCIDYTIYHKYRFTSKQIVKIKKILFNYINQISSGNFDNKLLAKDKISSSDIDPRATGNTSIYTKQKLMLIYVYISYYNRYQLVKLLYI